MNKLVQTIETIQAKLDGWRRHEFKETSTRTIVIDPLLEALGWDVRDPDEVQLEYPTVDGKSVDYALKINNNPVLLVEAKALDDPLNDVKAITQVVGYAANDGIVWCILTNGLKWKVYRSVEKCPAPDKLMFELTLDPKEAEDMKPEQIAEQMWRFSREEMAKGTLDALGEQTFTDGKVRKALDEIMRHPPRPFINIIKKAIGDEKLKPQKIGESLARVWTKSSATELVNPQPAIGKPKQERVERDLKKSGRAKRRESVTDETYHTSGKSKEALELYHSIDRFCLSLEPDKIKKFFRKKTIAYWHKKEFCSVHIKKHGLLVWLHLKYAHLEHPPSFARDVSNVGHWGSGDLGLKISNSSQLAEAHELIRQSFEAQCKGD